MDVMEQQKSFKIVNVQPFPSVAYLYSNYDKIKKVNIRNSYLSVVGYSLEEGSIYAISYAKSYLLCSRLIRMCLRVC